MRQEEEKDQEKYTYIHVVSGILKRRKVTNLKNKIQ